MTEEQKIEVKVPTCTKAPWKEVVKGSQKQEILRAIRQECIDIYGHDLERCPKSKVCLTKSCMGRPLPWKSKTAKPYLEELEKITNMVVNSTTGEKEQVVQTNCKECHFYSKCKSPCDQVTDFMERDSSPDTIKPYNIIYKDNLENIIAEETSSEPANFRLADKDLAWDCLTERNREIIKKYLYEERDFRTTAEKVGMLNQAYCKVIFYYSITRLAKFSIMRKFYNESKEKLTEKQQLILYEVYFNNKKYKEVAQTLSMSAQAVHLIVKGIISSNSIKWPKFVTTANNKPKFNVFKLFK